MMSRFTDFLKKRKFIIAIVIIAILLIIVIGGGNGDNGSMMHNVTERTVTERVEVAGKVQSNDFAELGFEVVGKVTSVLAAVGDEVVQGQTLVRLDTSALSADLADAEANIVIKQAELTNTGSSLMAVTQKQNALVDTAYQNLLSSSLVVEPKSSSYTQNAPVISGRYTGPEGFYKIIIDRGNTSNNHEFSVFGLESVRDIEIQKTTATPLGTHGLFIDFPDALSTYVDTIWYVYIPNVKSSVYTANYNAYQEALRERDRAVDAAEAELRSHTTSSIAQAELSQAKAAVSRIKSEIAQRIIRAPFSGAVSFVDAEVGEIVSSGNTVVSVVSDGDFEIELEVPEIDISKIEVGNIVDIQLDAFGSREVWQGEIVAISQSETYVDGVPVYQTNVRFTEPDERIRSGLSATVTIMTETRDGVVAVPAEFIDRDENGAFVYIAVDEDETERRAIVTGLRGSDGFMEILEGLSAGDVVATES